MDAIDLLVAHCADEGQQAADYIKDQLGSADLYATRDLIKTASFAAVCVCVCVCVCMRMRACVRVCV